MHIIKKVKNDGFIPCNDKENVPNFPTTPSPPLPLSATQISAQHMSKSKDSIIDIWPL